jgi:uncharacterized protein involved in response to NO
MSVGLLQLGKKPVAAPAGPVLLQSGFRPFFLLAALVAVVAVSAWIAACGRRAARSWAWTSTCTR